MYVYVLLVCPFFFRFLSVFVSFCSYSMICTCLCTGRYSITTLSLPHTHSLAEKKKRIFLSLQLASWSNVQTHVQTRVWIWIRIWDLCTYSYIRIRLRCVPPLTYRGYPWQNKKYQFFLLQSRSVVKTRYICLSSAVASVQRWTDTRRTTGVRRLGARTRSWWLSFHRMTLRVCYHRRSSSWPGVESNESTSWLFKLGHLSFTRWK
jgi:hypothetical protein